MTSKQHGLYRDKLAPDAKNRYSEKINIIGNVDPYEIPKDRWIRDPDASAPETFADIFTYLVCGVSAYAAAQFRNCKSLEARVHFTSGRVRDPEIYKPVNGENAVVGRKARY